MLFMFLFFLFFFPRDQQTKQKKKKMSQKTHLVAVFDCRTIIVGYYNNIIIKSRLITVRNLYAQHLDWLCHFT